MTSKNFSDPSHAPEAHMNSPLSFLIYLLIVLILVAVLFRVL
jgi:hypothetical protein